MYAEVSPTNDAGNGLLNTWVGSVLDDYKYTSNSGTRTLTSAISSGSRTTSRDPDLAGQVFQWMGTSASGRPVDRRPDGRPFTGSTGYDDFELWKVLDLDRPDQRLGRLRRAERDRDRAEQGRPFGSSNSYYGLIDHNDVRTAVEAYIQDSTVNVAGDVSIVATDAARISATEDSYVVPWDGVGGVIAVNGVLSSADAWLKDTPLYALGDLTVDAEHLAQIDASSTSRIEVVGCEERGRRVQRDRLDPGQHLLQRRRHPHERVRLLLRLHVERRAGDARQRRQGSRRQRRARGPGVRVQGHAAGRPGRADA